MTVPAPRGRWLLERLPSYLAEDDFLGRFVGIFEQLGDSLRDGIDVIEHLPDPSVTPEAFLPWLATWVGIPTVDPSMNVRRQRHLVGVASRRMGWRGTARGAREALEAMSGVIVDIHDNGGVFPAGEAPLVVSSVWVSFRTAPTISDADIVALVLREVPAHVALEIRVAGRRLEFDDRSGVAPPAPPPRRPATSARARTPRRVPLRASPHGMVTT